MCYIYFICSIFADKTTFCIKKLNRIGYGLTYEIMCEIQLN